MFLAANPAQKCATSVKYLAIVHAGLGALVVLWLQQILANPSDVELILAQFLSASLAAVMVGLTSLGALLLLNEREARGAASWTKRFPVYAKIASFLSMLIAFIFLAWGVLACIGGSDSVSNEDGVTEASAIHVSAPRDLPNTSAVGASELTT